MAKTSRMETEIDVGQAELMLLGVFAIDACIADPCLVSRIVPSKFRDSVLRARARRPDREPNLPRVTALVEGWVKYGRKPTREGHTNRAKGVGRKWEKVDPVRVFERDGWRCQICGKPTARDQRGTTHPKAPEIDHRIPLAAGGDHTYANTQCAHRRCNGKKSSRSSVGQLPLWELLDL